LEEAVKQPLRLEEKEGGGDSGPHNDVPATLGCVSEKLFRKSSSISFQAKEQTTINVFCGKTGGKILADLVMGGSSSLRPSAGDLEPVRPLLLLPEINDSSAWWDGKLHFPLTRRTKRDYCLREVGTDVFPQYQAAQSDRDPVLVGSAATEMESKLGSFDPGVAGGGGETFLFFYYTRR
jgi:hypothetical protein